MQTGKLFSVVLGGMLILSLHSCAKEKCAECFTEETSDSTGEVITTPLGELCGEELENTDGKVFTSTIGPARTYCE